MKGTTSIIIVLFGIFVSTCCAVPRPLFANEEPLWVLLTNGNVLRGTLSAQEGVVVLEREDGSHLRIPRNQVAFAAATMEDLYQHRSNQNAFRSPAVFIENVKWCIRFGLKEQAEAELANLLAVDPTNPESLRLKRQLESADRPRESAPVKMSSEPARKELSKTEEFAPPNGFSIESIAEFATRVQPMLINRCGNAGCHRSGSDTSWQLSHLGVNVRVSARMTQKNLHGLLPYINLDDPFSSDVLRYTQTPHGNGTYVPAGRTAQSAEMTLRQWLSQLGRYPQPLVLGSISNPPTANSPIANSLPGVPTVGQTSFDQQDAVPSRWPVQPISQDQAVPDGFAIDSDGELIYDPDGTLSLQKPTALSPPEASTNRPKRLPSVPNPFSADIFNRRNQLIEPTSGSK